MLDIEDIDYRLRTLPSPQRDDPRIDLARCEPLAALTNHQKLVEAADLTIEKARARGADSIVANASRLQSAAYRRLGFSPHNTFWEANGDLRT